MRNRTKGAVSKARYLRKNTSAGEELMWSYLKENFPEMRFRRQYPVDSYFLDFYSPRHRLCVELDGPLHEREKDKGRDSYLEEKGIYTLRFTTEQFINRTGEVRDELKYVQRWLKPRFTTPRS